MPRCYDPHRLQRHLFVGIYLLLNLCHGIHSTEPQATSQFNASLLRPSLPATTFHAIFFGPGGTSPVAFPVGQAPRQGDRQEFTAVRRVAIPNLSVVFEAKSRHSGSLCVGHNLMQRPDPCYLT